MSQDAITAIVATDGSEYSLQAAYRASTFLQTNLIHSVTILYVAETTKDVTILTNLRDTLTDEGKEIIDRTVAVMPYRENVSTEILFGDPSQQICQYAHTHETDLIVLGVKGRSAVLDIVMGSVCNNVMHHAPCSVLLIRKPEYSAKKHLHALEPELDPNSESIA